MARRRQRSSGWRTARRFAWARVGWVFWPVFIFGPILLVVGGLALGWTAVSWVAARIPPGQHTSVALAVAGAVVLVVVVWRWLRLGTWLAVHRRQVAAWSLAVAGVGLLVGAACATGGTWT